MTMGFDLLIVGGGLVGSSLALKLADSGLKIGVIEAQNEAERTSSPASLRALALSRSTVQNLQTMNVWEPIRKEATPIKHIHVSDKGHFGKTRIHAKDKGVEALGYVVVAKVLEKAIDLELRHQSITLISPARVIALKAGPDRICVTLKHGEENITASARLLIGADGANSTIRSLLKIGQKTREYGQTAIITEVRTQKDHGFTAYERFTTTGPLAFLPLDRRTCSVVWTQTHENADALLKQGKLAVEAALQLAFGYWLGEIELLSKPVGFPLKLIRADRMLDERVLLIGNAMHQIHPVAGQGFNLGLRDAELLADRIKTQIAFDGDIGDPEFLKHYVSARKEDLDKVITFTDGLVRIFSNDLLPISVVRNLALVVLDRFPAAKRLLARHAMGYGVNH